MADSVELSSVILRGTRAAQPLATSVCAGVLYYVTDERKTEQSNGSAWVTFKDGPPPVFNNGSVTGTVTINWNNAESQLLTLAGNVTLAAPSNPLSGFIYNLVFIQDATGGRTITFPGSFKISGGAFVLTVTAAGRDTLTVLFDGTNYNELSRANNLS